MTSKRTIAICVITYLRPRSLERLLHSLQQQECSDSYDIRIVVVDNAPATGSGDIITSAATKGPYAVKLVEEPERGIPFARNKAVEAAGEVDAIIFIDDDEVAPAGWLNALLKTWEDTQADIVTGPARAILPQEAPAWAVKSKTYDDQRQHVTGEQIPKAYTNNTLINATVLKAVQPRFDVRYRYTGGSDSHFFQRAVKQGFKIVWCQEAQIEEIVPASRIKLSWLAKRSFRNGSNDTFTRLDLCPDWRTKLLILKLAARRGIYGIASLLKGAIKRNWQITMAGYRMIFESIGTLAGLVGIRYNEYKSIHGN